MKRSLLCLIMFILCLAATAYAQEDDKNYEFFGIAGGCFIPQDINFKDVYTDERGGVFSLSYDKEISGNFGVGTSLMYYKEDGKAVSRTLEKTTVDTTFTLAKAELSAVYRLALSEGQPIVPQFKAGINCSYFNEKIKDGDRTQNAYFGYHAGFALLFLLDRLDPENARALKMNYGVEDTYFSVGIDYSNTDDFKERKLNLSGVEYSAGLVFKY